MGQNTGVGVYRATPAVTREDAVNAMEVSTIVHYADTLPYQIVDVGVDVADAAPPVSQDTGPCVSKGESHSQDKWD